MEIFLSDFGILDTSLLTISIGVPSSKKLVRSDYNIREAPIWEMVVSQCFRCGFCAWYFVSFGKIRWRRKFFIHSDVLEVDEKIFSEVTTSARFNDFAEKCTESLVARLVKEVKFVWYGRFFEKYDRSYTGWTMSQVPSKILIEKYRVDFVDCLVTRALHDA